MNRETESPEMEYILYSMLFYALSVMAYDAGTEA